MTSRAGRSKFWNSTGRKRRLLRQSRQVGRNNKDYSKQNNLMNKKMCNCNEMLIYVSVLFLASTIVCGTSVPPTCPPNLFPHRANGEFHCCDFCSPGHYVVEYCNRSNKTQCAQCPANQLYDERNEYRQCYPCAECGTNTKKKRSCTPTSDTVCACQTGFYEVVNGECSACRSCPPGTGIVQDCTEKTKRLCQPCEEGKTFASNTNEKCKQCSHCLINEVKIKNCTLTTDTVCKNVAVQVPGPPSSKREWPSIVLIVLIVLITTFAIFVVMCCFMKRLRGSWSCRRQETARTSIERRPTTSSQQPTAAPEEETHLRVDFPVATNHEPENAMHIRDLPYLVKEELARLMDQKRLIGKNWRSVAGHLEYTQVDLESFANDGQESPMLRVLLEYGTQRDATVSRLHKILLKIKRPDAADLLEPYLRSQSTQV